MAVAFDATVSVRGFGVTSLTTASFTIAGSDRAAQLQLSGDIVGSSGFSGSVGGASGAAISNADATDQNTSLRVLCFGVTAPAAGSQTGTMSWTGSAADVTLGVITATGVDQTTSLNNGNNANSGFGGPTSLQITSTSGDLTCTASSSTSGSATTNQTSRWASGSGAGDTGPGTGTTTHSWSTGNWIAAAGANFKPAAGGGRTTKNTRAFPLGVASGMHRFTTMKPMIGRP